MGRCFGGSARFPTIFKGKKMHCLPCVRVQADFVQVLTRFSPDPGEGSPGNLREIQLTWECLHNLCGWLFWCIWWEETSSPRMARPQYGYHSAPVFFLKEGFTWAHSSVIMMMAGAWAITLLWKSGSREMNASAQLSSPSFQPKIWYLPHAAFIVLIKRSSHRCAW